MPDLEWSKLLALAATSGIVAGVVNQMAAFVREHVARKSRAREDAKTRSHQVEMQANEIRHKRDMQEQDLAHQRQLAEEALAKQDEDRRQDLAHQRQMAEQALAKQDEGRRDEAHSAAREKYLRSVSRLWSGSSTGGRRITARTLTTWAGTCASPSSRMHRSRSRGLEASPPATRPGQFERWPTNCTRRWTTAITSCRSTPTDQQVWAHPPRAGLQAGATICSN